MRLLHRGLRHGPDAQGLPRAATINRLARFYIDPRDNRSEDEYYDVIGNDQAYSAAWASSLRRRLPQEDSPSRPARHHAPYAGPQVRQGILPKALYEKFKGCGSHCQ